MESPGGTSLKHKTKYVFFIILLCFLSELAAYSVFDLPVSTIILDPGHGGTDPGAVSQFNGHLMEKDVVLAIALEIREIIKAKHPGLSVVMTREDDSFIPLDQRAAIARTTDPGPNEQAVFISIHTNSIGIESVSGFEILIKSMNKKIQFFTSGIQGWQLLRYAKESDSQLNAALNRANTMLASAIRSSVTDMFPDMRDRGVKEQDVWVLNASAIPSVLVETSFISNEQDSNNMASSEWITAMAHAIAEGILNFVAIIQ